ncbi:MAG: hypothetical protein IJL80_00800, partial [Treponema sp.]|nr:hypothetical protein [Treponema sp.]
YEERGYDRLYDLYIGQHLVYLQSIYYRIRLFEDDEGKKGAYLPMIEGAFSKYLGACLATPRSSASEKLSAFLFARLRSLWWILVGRLILARKYGR